MSEDTKNTRQAAGIVLGFDLPLTMSGIQQQPGTVITLRKMEVDLLALHAPDSRIVMYARRSALFLWFEREFMVPLPSDRFDTDDVERLKRTVRKGWEYLQQLGADTEMPAIKWYLVDRRRLIDPRTLREAR